MQTGPGRLVGSDPGLPGQWQRGDLLLPARLPADLHVGRGLPARRQRRAERFICEYHRAPAWLGKLSAGSCSAYWNGESPAWFP